MDRPTTREEADARGSQLDPTEAFVLPSRRPALDLCLDPGRIGAGPILLTGDAGVGKTWLWRRLAAEAPPRRWLNVNLTPTNEPADLYRLISHELGLSNPGQTAASRVDLVDDLADRQTDGERVALVIEEAQNLSMAVWEEVRVLANRLDRPGGFTAILLVGQTALARRVKTRPFAAIEARLAGRVHLGPIDVDEAGEWIGRLRPDREWSVEQVEALHRDSTGNPRRLLMKLGTISRSSAAHRPELKISKQVAPIIRPVTARSDTTLPSPSPAPLTGPEKPPIRVEENMIEVGWSPEDVTAPGESEGDQARAKESAPASEESVKDHYAALQAWREWTENQGRRASAILNSPELEHDASSDPGEDEEELSSPLADRPTVWADGQQRFAPFSQLFSRMAQVREPE